MRKTILWTLCLALIACGTAFASGTSGPSPATGSFGADPHMVTETIRGTVTRVVGDGGVFVRIAEDQPEFLLPYSDDTRFVAQSKKEFDGRKKLRPADLKSGHELKITLRPATLEIVKVKVLKQS